MRSLARGLVAAIVFVACQSSPPPPSATPSQVVLPAAPSTAPTTVPSPKTSLGGTLRVALSDPIGTLDPQFADANPLVIGQVFEGLVARGENGVVPALATKWLVAPDGVTWTFALRSGVTFHDGTPLDAAAAAKSLLNGKKPSLASAAAGADPLTLTLVTGAPDGRLLSALATPAFAIVSPSSRAVGTGPFRVPTGGENARPLTLERNERYWRADASGQRLPYLDKLVFSAVPDSGTRLASIRAGNVDLIQDLAIADAGTVRTDPSLRVASRPPAMVLSLALNLSLPPMDDLRVRQAVAQAVSGRTIADRNYAGLATAAAQLPLPGMLGYDDSVGEFAKNDPAAAKKLLADSGHANLEVDLWYVLDGAAWMPDMRRVAETVAADLAAAGIVVTLKTIDAITFAASVKENRYPLWLALATAPSFDPDDLFGTAFIPPVVNGQDQPTEAGGWTNKEVAGLLRRARSEPDQSKRAELYKQVSKVVQREIPRIPLVWTAAPAAATKKVLDPQAELFARVALTK